jgi:hypothetical protein
MRLFGVLKTAKKNQHRDDGLSAQADHVLPLIRAYEQATTTTTVRSFWVKTGFQCEERDDSVSYRKRGRDSVMNRFSGHLGIRPCARWPLRTKTTPEMGMDQSTSLSQKRGFQPQALASKD